MIVKLTRRLEALTLKEIFFYISFDVESFFVSKYLFNQLEL